MICRGLSRIIALPILFLSIVAPIFAQSFPQTASALPPLTVAMAAPSQALPLPAQTEPPRDTRWDSAIDAILRRQGFDSTEWSVLIRDSSNGRTLYSRNSDKSLLPASNRKLFTTALALDRLGPDFRFATDLHLIGRKDTMGRFRGDLVVKAVGDPTISARWSSNGRSDQRFRAWARELLAQDVRYIQGDLIVDISAFPAEERYAEGWQADQLTRAYSAPVGAFSFNENVISVSIRPGASAGAPCVARLVPNLGDFTIVNNSTTTASGSERLIADRRGDEHVIELRGSLPLNAGPRTVNIAVADPARYASHALLQVLQEEGIRVVGQLRISETPVVIPPEAILALRCESPPLEEIILPINQNSNNFLAEHLFKAVGYHAAGDGSYAGAAAEELRFLKEIGICPESVFSADGSGLSRLNRTSAADLVQLLEAMQYHPHADAFRKSLGVSGQNGSLRRRMGEMGSQGRFLGKTGYIRGVSCLSGYLQRADGSRITLSIMSNFPLEQRAYPWIKAQDDICHALTKAPAPR